jgi:hypothetical protein
MRRCSIFVLSTFVISSLLFVAPAASASTHPTGSTTCFVAGAGTVNPPLSGSVPSVRPLRSKIKGNLTTCDNSLITGSQYPITNGSIDITAKLPTGSTCFTLLSNPFADGKIKLKWLGLVVIDGFTHYKKQGSSTATISKASIYTENGDYGIRMVSAGIEGSAFAGEVMTIELDLGDITTLENACETPDGTISSITVDGERVVVAPTEAP